MADVDVPYLIGAPTLNLPSDRQTKGIQLPSKGDMLRVVKANLEKKCSVKDSMTAAVVQASAVWEKVNIPVMENHKVIIKLQKIHDEFLSIKKNKHRNKAAQRNREEEFQKSLTSLFDIGKANVIDVLPPPVKEFLLASRKDRATSYLKFGINSVVFSNVCEKREFATTDKNNNSTLSPSAPIAGCSNSVLRPRIRLCEVPRSKSETSDESLSEEVSSDEYEPHPKLCKRQKRTEDVPPELLAIFDRRGISKRASASILSTALKSQGGKSANSISSVYRLRLKTRIEIAAKIREEFEPEGPLTVHFDSKQMNDLTEQMKIERLPVLVSGQGLEQFLAAPAIKSTTGKEQALAVEKILSEWNLTNKVKCMSGDTTNSVSGRFKGAITILSKRVNHDMLYLACRKHMYETILEGVAIYCTGASKSPEVELFRTFKGKWTLMNKLNYQDGPSDEFVWDSICDNCSRVIEFCMEQLKNQQPREDYKELLELAIIFGGETPPGGISFQKPGALSRARWMMYLIYAFKVWMFRGEFVMSTEDEEGLRQLCIFGFNVYIEQWYNAPLPTQAPRQDLSLLKFLRAAPLDHPAYQELKIAEKKLEKHLWYLNDRLAPLAFFDESVSLEEKVKMVQALKKTCEKNSVGVWRRDPKRVNADTNLCDLLSNESRKFFEILMIQTDFLEVHPQLWGKNKSYLLGKELVKTLQVSNDAAERGVALAAHCIKHCKIETNYQNFLQVVYLQRKLFPSEK